ncbi:MAG: GWxTD domain-containing protein [Terriglobia bacterium]
MRLLDVIIGTQISQALGWTLIHSLWQGCIIAAAFGAVLLSFRSPRIRYAAGCMALLAMLASFAITLVHFLPERDSGSATLIKMVPAPWSAPPNTSGIDSHFPAFATLIPWLGPMWIVGVCIFYLRYAAGWLSLYRMRRRSVCSAADVWQRTVTRLAEELKVSRPVELLESLLADTPVVLGHVRPAVLVPLGFLASLPPEHVEAILLHELAHITRSDYLVNVGQRLIEGLLFYHPAVWWISHVIRAERENCCDDVVVDLRGDAHRYAVALTALEANRLGEQWPTREPSVAATGGNLMKRVKRLLYPQGPSGVWAPALAAVVLLASTAMVLAAWHGNPNSGPASEQANKKVDNTWQRLRNEEVAYLISNEEKTAFESLKTDEEREHFLKAFWVRANPTPGSAGNEFRAEYYRRIAYANKHWAWNQPGWKTDRGHIYIMYGPPDEIDSHPSGGNYKRPESEGGGSAVACPFEDWRYAHFQGLGSLSIEFIDPASSGEYRMTLDPKEKYKER